MWICLLIKENGFGSLSAFCSSNLLKYKDFKDIAAKLNIEGTSNYVRVSELKKQAVQKLIENVDHSQVIDYL